MKRTPHRNKYREYRKYRGGRRRPPPLAACVRRPYAAARARAAVEPGRIKKCVRMCARSAEYGCRAAPAPSPVVNARRQARRVSGPRSAPSPGQRAPSPLDFLSSMELCARPGVSPGAIAGRPGNHFPPRVRRPPVEVGGAPGRRIRSLAALVLSGIRTTSI